MQSLENEGLAIELLNIFQHYYEEKTHSKDWGPCLETSRASLSAAALASKLLINTIKAARSAVVYLVQLVRYGEHRTEE